MKILELIKNCISKFIVKFFIIATVWMIFSIICSLLVQPFTNNFRFTIVFGLSNINLFSMITAGYVCFLLYSKIISIETFSDVADRFKKEIIKICNDSQKKPNKRNNNLNKSEVKYDEKLAKFAYEKLLGLRDLDNELMWTRINMLIVFQGVLLAAIAAGFDILLKQPNLLLLITGAGFFSSVVLYSIAKGGSWWITHWEKALATIEPNVLGEIHIFAEPHHHANDPTFKTKKKKEGYVSTRDWILIFTIALPLLWIIIFIVSLSISNGSPNTI